MKAEEAFNKAKEEVVEHLKEKVQQTQSKADAMDKASGGTDPRVKGMQQLAKELENVKHWIESSVLWENHKPRKKSNKSTSSKN